MKKVWITLLVALVMVFAMTSTVSAASAADVLAALKAGNVPEVYLTQAESYFASNPITSTQADQLITHIQTATTTADGESKLSKLSGAQRTAIVDSIGKAAQVLSLTATYGNETITVKNSSGQVVIKVDSASAIKQTGNDYTIVIAGLALIIMAGGAALLSRKAQGRR